MLCGLAAGALFYTTALHPEFARLTWLLAAALVQLRLLANMFDGMVAVETNTASPVGELFNEVPDRVSDAAILVGLGYAAGGTPATWILGGARGHVHGLCSRRGKSRWGGAGLFRPDG